MKWVKGLWSECAYPALPLLDRKSLVSGNCAARSDMSLRENSTLLHLKSEIGYSADENNRLYEINGELAVSKQYQEQNWSGMKTGFLSYIPFMMRSS